MSASAQCHAVFELINLYELLEFIFIYPKFRKSLEYKALTCYMKGANKSYLGPTNLTSVVLSQDPVRVGGTFKIWFSISFLRDPIT